LSAPPAARSTDSVRRCRRRKVTPVVGAADAAPCLRRCVVMRGRSAVLREMIQGLPGGARLLTILHQVPAEGR